MERPLVRGGGLRIQFFQMGLDNPLISAWFGGVYRSFFSALEQCGCAVSYTMADPDPTSDVLVVTMGGRQDRPSAQAIASFGGPVVVYVPPAAAWFRPEFLSRWRSRVLFTYGTDLSPYSERHYEALGVPYYSLPFGSSPEVMAPLEVPKLFDVIFVGSATSGKGRYDYIDALTARAAGLRLMFVGPGWERYGFPSQSIAWGETLNVFYNLAHVCINLHNDEQKRVGVQLDANNRLFDLAMAGCFQVSNAPQVVRRYFGVDEIIAVDPPDEWASAVMHYLDQPAAREMYRLAARRHALAEHTWLHRARRFVTLIEDHLATWHPPPLEPRSLHLRRLRDLYLPPDSPREFLRRATHKLRHIWRAPFTR